MIEVNRDNIQGSSPLLIQREEVWKNFDLSIIIPFYKKMKEFRVVFPRNRHFFERNGIEIVLVLDCPNEKDDLINYVKQYPFINWRIVLNDKPHEWRNPAKPLNVGIRHATKRFVMVCSPESEFLTDAILILRQTFEDYDDTPHYAIGRVCFANENDCIDITNFDEQSCIPFGSIMVERKYLNDIHGYDETLSKWGGDDNNIRARLDMVGVEELYMNNVMLVHRDIDNEEGKIRREDPFTKMPNEPLRHFFFPTKVIANKTDWGRDFDEIIYDWKNNVYAEEQLKEYLKLFPNSSLKVGSPKKEYPLILLFSAYNEGNGMESVLKHAAKHFDAMIMLDDGSSDKTYESAINDKIILKVKKTRTEFNDLENRNMLLNLASFFKFTLACFIDTDERFDERFCDLRKYIDDVNANAYIVPFIHLWDDENTYNGEYPGAYNGICLRYKMFRNIGHSRIYSNRGKLHFYQVPTMRHTRISMTLIKHYGILSREARVNKYNFYQEVDTEKSQDSYDHFIKENINLSNVDEITLDTLRGTIGLLKKEL